MQQTMNDTRAIFLISKEVRAIEVTYESHCTAPKTIFKTLSAAIKVDDFVVVQTDTRHKMTVCKVTAVDVEIDVEGSTDIDWVLGVVGLDDINVTIDQEKELLAKIKSANKRRRQKELAEALLADAGADDEIKKLCVFTDPQAKEE